jgi:DNA-binding SARP family transcriptional activator
MYGMAMEMAMTAVRADVFRESAHRVVIRIHLAEGNVAEALHAYRHCSTLLEREFGLTPSRETAELVSGFEPLQPLLS